MTKHGPGPYHRKNNVQVDYDPDWKTQARCREEGDPEAWFPDRESQMGPAIKMCKKCPVIASCLAYALANDERWGVWGGKSPRQRMSLGSSQLHRHPA